MEGEGSIVEGETGREKLIVREGGGEKTDVGCERRGEERERERGQLSEREIVWRDGRERSALRER